MRKLLVLILLIGAFAGGYYLRGRPNSPDVFGWVRRTVHTWTGAQGDRAGQQAAAQRN